MSNKTYKLIKDLPYCKAGTIWTKANAYDEYNFNFGFKWNAIPSDEIEKMTDWFEEVHQCRYCKAWTSQPDEECYKTSTPNQPPKERIEVGDMWRSASVVAPKETYSFLVSEMIPPEKFPAIKAAIERELNDDEGEDKWKFDLSFLAERYTPLLLVEFIQLLKELAVKSHKFDFAADVRLIENVLKGELPKQKGYTEQQLLEAEQKAFEAGRMNMETWGKKGAVRFMTFETFDDYKNNIIGRAVRQFMEDRRCP